MSAFNYHCDSCRQCREHPFGLCPEGVRALQADATGPTNVLDLMQALRESIAAHSPPAAVAAKEPSE